MALGAAARAAARVSGTGSALIRRVLRRPAAAPPQAAPAPAPAPQAAAAPAPAPQAAPAPAAAPETAAAPAPAAAAAPEAAPPSRSAWDAVVGQPGLADIVGAAKRGLKDGPAALRSSAASVASWAGDSVGRASEAVPESVGDVAEWAADALGDRGNVLGLAGSAAADAAKKVAKRVLGAFEPPEPGTAMDVFGAVTLYVLFTLYWARGAAATMERCGGGGSRAGVNAEGVGVGQCSSENVTLGILMSGVVFLPMVAMLGVGMFIVDAIGFSEMAKPFTNRAPGAPLLPTHFSIGTRIIASWLLDLRMVVALFVGVALSCGFAFVYLKVQELRRVPPAKWQHSIRVALAFNLVVTLLLMVGQKACDIWWLRSATRGG